MCCLCETMLLLLPNPFIEMEARRKTTEPQKRGKLSRAWTTGRKETELPKSERRRVRSWTVQNEMRGVLGRVSTGTAGRILDSANPEEIRA